MDWTRNEIALIVQDYFDMLQLELQHRSYNKSEHRRALTTQMPNRAKAIEFKHQNISAALIELGRPFIKGYKPLYNRQQLLFEEVYNYLTQHRRKLDSLFEKFSEEKTPIEKPVINFENVLNEDKVESKFKLSKSGFKAVKIDYLKKEQNNRSLGQSGEEFVLNYEKWRLNKLGKSSLAKKIRWVSKDEGDGLGYDIHSKNENGSDRFIEVKTTKLTKETPIYISQTELRFALTSSKDFYLYRVFNFGNNTQLFIRHGNYEAFCKMIPVGYQGFFI
jgi:hypothetical protein